MRHRPRGTAVSDFSQIAAPGGVVLWAGGEAAPNSRDLRPGLWRLFLGKHPRAIFPRPARSAVCRFEPIPIRADAGGRHRRQLNEL